jgi:hypothetical protein
MMDGVRRSSLILLCLAVCSGAAYAQQPALITQLMNAPGTVRGQGHNTTPAGAHKLLTYRVHQLALSQPVTVNIHGKSVTTSTAYRLTVTGGPFAARAIPPVIEIDGVAAGVALESADQSALRFVTFDPALLHQGARVTVAYGDVRSDLPETLNLN